MANSKLHDDLVNEVEPLETPEESIKSLMLAVADRIEGCNGNLVKLSDLATVLRENPEAVGKAVLANTPAARHKIKTTNSDSPSSAFEKPRPGVTPMTNDHRDQVSPPNSNTEAERQRINREQVARDRGAQVVVNEPMPQMSEEARKADEDRRRQQSNQLGNQGYNSPAPL